MHFTADTASIVIPIVIRVEYLDELFTSADYSLASVQSVVCMQIEIFYAVFSTTTPCLRPFMSALSTNYGGPTAIKTPKTTANSGSGNEYSLSSLTGRLKREGRTKEVPRMRWDDVQYLVAVEAEAQPEERPSVHGSDRKMTISKDTEWAVDYESQTPKGESSAA